MVSTFDIVQLNEIALITRLAGYEYSSYWKEEVDGPIIALRGFNIGKNCISLKEITTISNDLSLKLKRSRLCKNDVVYPCVGTIGNAAVIKEDNKYHIQQNIARIVPDLNQLDSQYLAHYLMSEYGSNEIQRFNGTSSQPNILVGSLRQYYILLPSLPEQRAIASALSDADDYITALEKLIAKKRAVKQGAMQELLTGKRRIPGFSDEWVGKKLGEIGEIITGATPATSVNEYWNGNILWVTPTDITDKKNIQNVERKISELGLAKIRELPPNTLLVTCIASIGKNAILRSRGASNQQINAIIPFNEYDVDFLYYLIENNKLVLEGKAGITATKIVSKNEFTEIEMLFPPIKGEQTAIAQILSDMDAEIDALTAKLEKTRHIKQGMMSELLTGRIRLIEEDKDYGKD